MKYTFPIKIIVAKGHRVEPGMMLKVNSNGEVEGIKEEHIGLKKESSSKFLILQ